ncbi:MAG: hypothetical protein AAF384_04250 [Pseudomonadota bacterium]
MRTSLLILLVVALISAVSNAEPLHEAATAEGYLQVVRLVGGDENQTKFVDTKLPLKMLDFAPPAPPNQISEHLPATKVTFGKLPPGWFGDWHPTPRKQYIVLMQGAFEIETGNGEKRIFKAGDLMLLEDTEGRGHATRVVGDDSVHYAAIAVP